MVILCGKELTNDKSDSRESRIHNDGKIEKLLPLYYNKFYKQKKYDFKVLYY